MFGSLKTQKNPNIGGIGLGLVISKLIVNKFQGKITFHSIENVGSSFSFSFAIEKINERYDIETTEEDLFLQDSN